MGIRKILVPLSGKLGDEAVLSTACGVAKNFQAQVVGLFVRPDPAEALPYLGDGVTGRVIEDILTTVKEGSDEASKKAQTALEKVAGEQGLPVASDTQGPLPACRFLDIMGRADDVIAAQSRLSDLVVFGHGMNDEGEAGGSALEAAMMSAGRPVMIAPRQVPETIGGTVAIGWDSSYEAAHAVTAAMPFLAKASRCVILCVDRDTAEAKPGSTLADYLKLHGIEADVEAMKAGDNSVGEVLLDGAQNVGADLLVMGGYGHSRLRELFVGGTTRHIRSHPVLPVLMAH